MNYEKLFQDVKSGEFDSGKLELVMGDDGGYWRGMTEDYDENERLEKLADDRYGTLGGDVDIVDVINAAGAAGVNCNRC